MGDATKFSERTRGNHEDIDKPAASFRLQFFHKSTTI